MECNPETLELLSRSLAETLSPEPEPRRHAEDYLSAAASTPNYSLAILRLVAEPSVDERIRQCAAVNFKNHLQTRCVPSSEKAQIKTLIVPLMLSTTPRIQAHLSQTLAIIADHDLPMLLSVLLPELNSSLQTAIYANDFASVNGILAGVNSLFKTDPIQLDLKYFAAPLLTTVESISGKINTADVSRATLCQLIEAQRLCFKIFYSLNFLDLPEFFKDTADKWMSEFKSYLTVRYPAIEDDIDGEGGVSVVDELRIAVCENITYYMEKEEELFQNYLKGFVEAVCSLFVVASASPNRQRLSVTAIKFLTIVSTRVHHELLAGDEILQQITRNIVIPTVTLLDEDEELFEMNYVEFIRRDMEGSDLDTRRRIAIELLKGIAGNYKDKITERVSIEINNCLAFFAENPAVNWKYKDCAIYLVVSFATKKASVGGALISTDLVNDVESFFRSVIVPELQEEDVNAFPMLKAGALKFFTMFRVLIPRPAAMAVLGDVVRFVGSDVNVVHSYAAACIEKLLLVKDNDGVEIEARYTSMDINPLLQVLMTNLFAALEKPGSEENEYVMRCMMRVLHVADSSEEVVSFCITKLSTILRRVCSKPKRPVFNHSLFKVVTILGPRTCQNKDVLLPAFEQCVRSPIRLIFGQDNVAVYPYAYQWLAQLCVMTKSQNPSPKLRWMHMISSSLCMWERDDSPSLPTLVIWFRAVVRHGPQPNLLQHESEVTYIVGLAKKLVSSPRTEEDGFHILNIVIEDCGYAVVKKFIQDIWDLLITRLQQNASPRFVKCMLVFMCLFMVKHGTRNLVDLINGDKGIRSYHVFVGEFWIPNLKIISGDINEVKLCAVASTKLICESPTLVDPAAAELWGKMLDAVVTLLSLPQPQEERLDDDDDDEPDLGKATGYLLHYAAKIVEDDEDPLKELKDPKHFIVTQLASLSSEFRGRFHPFITTYVSPTNQAALLQMCNSYNLSIL